MTAKVANDTRNVFAGVFAAYLPCRCPLSTQSHTTDCYCKHSTRTKNATDCFLHTQKAYVQFKVCIYVICRVFTHVYIGYFSRACAITKSYFRCLFNGYVTNVCCAVRCDWCWAVRTNQQQAMCTACASSAWCNWVYVSSVNFPTGGISAAGNFLRSKRIQDNCTIDNVATIVGNLAIFQLEDGGNYSYFSYNPRNNWKHHVTFRNSPQSGFKMKLTLF